MEHLHKEPASDVSAEAASLIRGTNVDVLEAALRLLMDERWAARRRAVEVLGALQSETARQALMSLLKIERDFEMHRAIEAALKPG
jgi:HEAT repeat protein